MSRLVRNILDWKESQYKGNKDRDKENLNSSNEKGDINFTEE